MASICSVILLSIFALSGLRITEACMAGHPGISPTHSSDSVQPASLRSVSHPPTPVATNPIVHTANSQAVASNTQAATTKPLVIATSEVPKSPAVSTAALAATTIAHTPNLGNSSHTGVMNEPQPVQVSHGQSARTLPIVTGTPLPIVGVVGPTGQQDSNWMEWTEWNQCTVSCGSGTRLRMRMCMPVGSNCVGKMIEEGGCNNQPCPTSVWSQWANWSDCNERCTRLRTRKCLGVNPIVPALCLGTVAEEQVCRDAPCRRNDVTTEWSSWSQWSTCGSNCRGNRTRQCSLPGSCGVENFETRKCSGDFCLQNAQVVGASVSVQQSNVIQPIIGLKLDSDSPALWLEWSEWTKCDCKAEKKIRHRNCTQDKCDGKNLETKECGQDSDECKLWASSQFLNNSIITAATAIRISPTVPISTASATGIPDNVTSYVDVVGYKLVSWSDWNEWSRCDCRLGRRSRLRSCSNPQPPVEFLESNCLGDDRETSDCQPDGCANVNGGWSAWSAYSSCPSSCVGQISRRYRQRICSNPQPVNDGSDCFGVDKEFLPCAPQTNCKNLTPVNGGLTEWSEWSKCQSPCGLGIQIRTRHCSNPYPSNGGSFCIGPLTETASCQNPACDAAYYSLIGGWNEWSGWSECSATCGRADRTSFRACINPRPHVNGPSRCQGRVVWLKPCYDLPLCPGTTRSNVARY